MLLKTAKYVFSFKNDKHALNKGFCFFHVFLSIKRSNCYMVWGGEFSSSQQTRVSQEDFVIGCLIDLDTGLMTFTANGKEINTFYQVK